MKKKEDKRKSAIKRAERAWRSKPSQKRLRQGNNIDIIGQNYGWRLKEGETEEMRVTSRSSMLLMD